MSDKAERPKIYSLEPVLQVNNLPETLRYYEETLCFHIDWVWPDDDKRDTADHASVSLGQQEGEEEEHSHHHSHIQLSQADKTPVANSGWLYFRVESDIDELYELFKRGGASISSEINSYPWGMREFDIRENNGHVFRFGKPVEQ